MPPQERSLTDLTPAEIDELRKSFDWVGFDAPPSLFVAFDPKTGLYHVKDWWSGTLCKTPHLDFVQRLVKYESLHGKGSVRALLAPSRPQPKPTSARPAPRSTASPIDLSDLDIDLDFN